MEISMKLHRTVLNERVTMGELWAFDATGNVAPFGGNERPQLFTLENPWLDNQPMISCIPAGKYICRRVESPTYGSTFEVADVEGRTHILFHWGNYPKNTQGCVLVGQSKAEDVPAVWRSRAAHAEFLKMTEAVDEFSFSIIEEES